MLLSNYFKEPSNLKKNRTLNINNRHEVLKLMYILLMTFHEMKLENNTFHDLVSRKNKNYQSISVPVGLKKKKEY